MNITEVFFIGIGVVLFVLIWFFRWILVQRSRSGVFDRQRVRAEWKGILKQIKNTQEMNYKLAIVEADTLLDTLLIQLACKGNTADERLTFAQLRYPKLKKVVWAHKLRKKVVADDYHIRYSVTRKVLSVFKQAFKDLGAL